MLQSLCDTVARRGRSKKQRSGGRVVTPLALEPDAKARGQRYFGKSLSNTFKDVVESAPT